MDEQALSVQNTRQQTSPPSADHATVGQSHEQQAFLVAARVILPLVLLLTPLLVSRQFKDVFQSPKTLFFESMVLLLGCIWIVDSVHRARMLVPSTTTMYAIGAVFLWQCASAAWSKVYCTTVRALLFNGSLTLLLFLCWQAGRRWERKTAEKLIIWASLGGVLAAGLGIAQYYGRDRVLLEGMAVLGLPDLTYLVDPLSPGSHPKMHSFFGNRNYLAGYLICLIPACTGALIKAKLEKRHSLSVFYALSTALMTICVILTHARGPWIGLAAALLLLFTMLRSGNSRKFIIGASVSLLLLLFLFGGGIEVLNRAHRSIIGRIAQTADLTQGSTLERFLIWKSAWHMATESPFYFLFGHGAGSFAYHYMPHLGAILSDPDNRAYLVKADTSAFAHSEILQTLCETGIVGLFLSLSAVWLFFASVRHRFGRVLKTGGDDGLDTSIIPVSLACGLIAVLLHNCVSFSIRLPSTAVLFFCFLGLCLSFGIDTGIELQPGRKALAPYLACIVILGIFTISAWKITTDIAVQRSWGKAYTAFVNRNYKEAIEGFEYALSLAPARGRLLFDFAFCLLETGNFAKAKHFFQRAAKVLQNPAVEDNLAYCCARLGMHNEAEQHLMRALEYNPVDEKALLALGRIFMSGSRSKQALVLLQKGMLYHRRNPLFPSMIAKIRLQSGDLKGALGLLKKAHNLKRKNKVFELDLSLCLFKLGRTKEALRHFRTVARDKGFKTYCSRLPRRTRIDILEMALVTHGLSGWARLELGCALLEEPGGNIARITRAAGLLRQVLTENPENGKARLYLAFALLEAGSGDEALKEMEAARLCIPASSGLRKKLEQLEGGIGKSGTSYSRNSRH